MNHFTLISLKTFLISLLTLSTSFALGSPSLEITVIDAYQNPLPTFYHQGQTYVMGRMGQRYSIKIDNLSNQRLEVVATVDGRDVINGKPGQYSHRGYVLMPHTELMIEGFRKNADEVAAFRFTNPSNSYAGRMGDKTHVGLIGVAIFEERVNRPRRYPRPRRPQPYFDSMPSHSLGLPNDEGASQERTLDDAPIYGSPRSSSRVKSSRKRAPSGRPQLGTEYGETRSSSSYEVTFVRRSSTPNRVYQFSYDSEAGLRRRGVLRSYPTTPSAFPAEARYAPPPP